MNESRRIVIQQFLDGLDDHELELLFVQLADRYKVIRRAKELQAMRNFRLMDRVFFHTNHDHITGTVIRINQRTLSVLSDGGRRWTVAPEYLHHDTTSTPDTEPTRVHVDNVTEPPAEVSRPPKQPPKNQKRKKQKKHHKR